MKKKTGRQTGQSVWSFRGISRHSQAQFKMMNVDTFPTTESKHALQTSITSLAQSSATLGLQPGSTDTKAPFSPSIFFSFC